MRRTSLLTMLAFALAVGGAMAVQQEDDAEFESEGEYNERMQEIDHSFETLMMERRQFWLGPDSQQSSAKLVELFDRVEQFWKGRGNEEAAGLASLAKEGAEQAREASRKRDEQAFNAAVDSIAASCVGCHQETLDKYRLRPGAPRPKH